ncbi:MAG: hypothetical protein J0I49_16845 [Pseudonocardia sp.]|nr:hypothetical protein [Pseudonocardia sp.]
MLSFLFAVQDEDKVTGGGGVAVIIGQALDSNGGGVLLLISAAGQFFCTIACMTSTTRMLFAFSRDGAVPGGRRWSCADRSTGAPPASGPTGRCRWARPRPPTTGCACCAATPEGPVRWWRPRWPGR